MAAIVIRLPIRIDDDHGRLPAQAIAAYIHPIAIRGQ
jgi:hypothetical protein